MTVPGSDFSSDCFKPKYKRRKISARRDFPKGFYQCAVAPEPLMPEDIPLKDDLPASRDFPKRFDQFAAANSDYDPEEVELDHESSAKKPIILARRDFPKGFDQFAAANSDYDPEEVELDHESSAMKPIILARRDLPKGFDQFATANSDYDPEDVELDRESSATKPLRFEPKMTEDKKNDLSEPKDKQRKIVYARRDYPEAFYQFDTDCESEDIEAIEFDNESSGSNSVGFEQITCVDEKESEMPEEDVKDEESTNQIHGNIKPLNSLGRRLLRKGKGDYLDNLLASLDQMAAALQQMKQQRTFMNAV